MEDIRQFHGDQVARYADNLIAVYKEKFKPEKNPKAYLLGGQPGAGKTTLQGFFYRKQHENLILLNGDNFRKGHPSYVKLEQKYGKEAVRHASEFSGKVTEYLVEKLSDDSYPLLIEGTLRTAEVPEQTAKLLKSKGYRTELSVIATKPELSYLGTILRYEMQLDAGMFARLTSKEDHDFVVENLIYNLESLYEKLIFDNITIFNRDSTCLYSQDESQENPRDILISQLFGLWSQAEKALFCEQMMRVQELMEKRNAQELPRFRDEEENLKKWILSDKLQRYTSENREKENDK